jgi:hypothetical protein
MKTLEAPFEMANLFLKHTGCRLWSGFQYAAAHVTMCP